MKKKCSNCKKNKTSDDFFKDKTNKDGFAYKCKSCFKIYKDKSKDKKKEYDKKYVLKNKSKRKEYYEKNRIVLIEKMKSNQKKNIKSRRASFKKYYKLKKLDPLYKLSLNIRNSIRGSFKHKNHKKNCKTSEILGCSFGEFKKYIESKFESWMTWENHGKYNGQLNYGWDLDHIIPKVTAKTETDIIRLNHFSNFQPLCSYINRNLKKDNLVISM